MVASSQTSRDEPLLEKRMITYDDLRNETEYEVDCIFAHGTDLERKYGARAIADLVDDGEFLSDLALLLLRLSNYGVPAMVASACMGIELTADPLRVLIAYVSSDQKFTDVVADKAYQVARKLVEAGQIIDASEFEKFVNEFEVSSV
jgi:hypothetical protein